MFLKTPLSFTPDEFKAYLSKINKPKYAERICLHHTASPSLVQRPIGFTPQHLLNLKSYYQNDLKWRSSPHIFIDDQEKCIHVLSDLTSPGTHAVSFNANSIGIEVLGDYDIEEPKLGRGLKCWQNAVLASQMLSDAFKIELNVFTLLFHRNDPKTQKTCPGKKVDKNWILSLAEFKPSPPKINSKPPTIALTPTISPPIPKEKETPFKRLLNGLWSLVRKI